MRELWRTVALLYFFPVSHTPRTPAANFETLEWLEFHAAKLLQKARVLETELAKFKTTLSSVTELAKKRSNGRGTHNLRWIASKVEQLNKELHQVRDHADCFVPKLARACSSLSFAAPSTNVSLQHKPARASSPDSVGSQDSGGLSGLDPRFLEDSP